MMQSVQIIKMMKIKYMIMLVALLITLPAMSQRRHKKYSSSSSAFIKDVRPGMGLQYISINGGGGISTIKYDLDMGDRKTGGGCSFTAEYQRFFNAMWGVNGGFGVAITHAQTSLDTTYTKTVIIPGEDKDYTSKYYINFEGWEEKQTNIALEIPIGALFRLPLRHNLTFFCGAGIKFSIPVKTSYSVKEGSREMTGEVEELGLAINPDMEQHDYYINPSHPTGNNDTKHFSAGIYTDANLVQKIKNLEVFYGIYGNLGLSSFSKDGGELGSGSDYNGVLSSDISDKARLRSFGIHAGVKLPLVKHKRRR